MEIRDREDEREQLARLDHDDCDDERDDRVPDHRHAASRHHGCRQLVRRETGGLFIHLRAVACFAPKPVSIRFRVPGARESGF